MCFIKRNQQHKTSSMQLILLLVPKRLKLEAGAGTGAGAPSYKMHLGTFDKGTPQEWMELLTGLCKIWQQNSVNSAHDHAATVAAFVEG
jgi:hypothetical protein